MARIIDGTEMNLIGSNLKRLRQERGWSQQLLSNKLETVAVYICRGSISRIEDKQRTVTDIYGRDREPAEFRIRLTHSRSPFAVAAAAAVLLLLGITPDEF